MAITQKQKYIRLLFAIAASLFSAASLTILQDDGGILAGSSHLWLLLWGGLCFLYSRVPAVWQKRRGLVCLAGGAVLAACQACGDMLAAENGFGYLVRLWPGYTLLYAAALLAVFAAADAFGEKAPAAAEAPAYAAQPGAKTGWGRLWDGMHILLNSDRKKHIVILFGLIILCWLPYYVLFFPGLVSPDVTTQMAMGLGGIPLTSHHPVVYTWFLAGGMQLGQWLFGSFAAGVALCTALQMLGTAAVAVWALRAMTGLCVRQSFRLGALLFYAVCPVVPWMAATLWKDVWLANGLLVLFLLLWRLEKQRAAFFKQPGQVTGLAAAALLVMLAKNNGIYLLAITMAVAALVLRGVRRQLAALLVACLVVWGLITGPGYAALGVQNGDVREMLSVPLLQVARVVKYEEEKLTDTDKALLAAVLPYDELAERYDYKVSDSIKFVFDSAVMREDPAAYAGLWLRLGLAAPGQYVLAFLEHSQGYWYPDVRYWMVSDTPYPTFIRQEGINFGGREMMAGRYAEPFAGAVVQMEQALQAQRGLPGLGLLYSIGFVFWVLLCCGLYAAYKKQAARLVPLLLYVVLWLTCITSPVYAEFRYAWPAVFAAPAVAGLCFGAKDDAAREAAAETKIDGNSK